MSNLIKISAGLSELTFVEAKELIELEAKKLSMIEVSEKNLKLAKGASTTLNKAKKEVTEYFKTILEPLNEEIKDIKSKRDELIKILEDNRTKINMSLKEFESKRVVAMQDAITSYYMGKKKEIKAETGVDVNIDISKHYKLGNVTFYAKDLFRVRDLTKAGKEAIDADIDIAKNKALIEKFEKEKAEAERKAREEELKRKAIEEHKEKERLAEIERVKEIERAKAVAEYASKNKPEVKEAPKDIESDVFTVCFKVKAKGATLEKMEAFVKSELKKTKLANAEINIKQGA